MSTPAALDNLGAEDWTGEMGAKWLANLERFEAMIAPAGAAFLAHVAPRPGERVIDSGCGGGGTTIAIARAVAPGGEALGIDIAPMLVAAARKRAEGLANIRFLNADAAMVRLGLDGRLRHVAVGRLSTGQRRRTSLACLVARRPELWLMDEPHAGLDQEGRDVCEKGRTSGSDHGFEAVEIGEPLGAHLARPILRAEIIQCR
jgi:SAM-dependent methyltransferase